MKPRCSKQRNHALTLVEVLVVIIVLAVLAVMLLPTGTGGKKTAQKISCINNLKQLGLAYKIWAGDNKDKYPMEISVTNGGAMELMNTPDAWKLYQVISNELGTPKVIICPEDSLRTSAATNFGEDLKNKISYFVSLDTTQQNPQFLLSGDDNFLLNNSSVKSGLVNVSSNAAIGWDTTRHGGVVQQGWFRKTKTGQGNGDLLLEDGSVQSVSRSQLLIYFNQTGLATNRLAIP